ncbi:MAG: hypothetical protein EXS16_03685 [Gemmataceae bacterium]|nr:hypothetical protein [Gemmataceae bacterium]
MSCQSRPVVHAKPAQLAWFDLLRRYLIALLIFVPACSQPTAPTKPVGEQNAQDIAGQNRCEAPALERQSHLTHLGVERWHRADIQGRGVTVCILDSGFRNLQSQLGKNLPPRVTTRSFRRDRELEARDSQHGLLCAEIVHALAPQANLLLANWDTDDPKSFLDAVRWAKSQGAKIVTCSLIMPSWSDGEGGGEVHRELQRILGSGDDANDMLFFASAGNTAQRHWCGIYSPSAQGWQRWNAAGEIENLLTPWGDERVAVELYGPTAAPFVVEVADDRTGRLIGSAHLEADASRSAGRAIVRFEPTGGKQYHVKVRCLDAKAADRQEAFHLVTLGGSLNQTTARGSIPFPGDGVKVIAIGAVDANGRRAPYSSCGPNSREPKPDFTAIVPFPTFGRARPFSGTSAAAPQGAGLAALLWSNQPNASASLIRDALKLSALDLGPPGHDIETGYGLLRLPNRP